MTKVEVQRGDRIVIDPCYIKGVVSSGKARFDALRCDKVLFEGSDGEYDVIASNGELYSLGVDSGRIWELVAEFECEVEIDSGLSGHAVIKSK